MNARRGFPLLFRHDDGKEVSALFDVPEPVRIVIEETRGLKDNRLTVILGEPPDFIGVDLVRETETKEFASVHKFAGCSERNIA